MNMRRIAAGVAFAVLTVGCGEQSPSTTVKASPSNKVEASPVGNAADLLFSCGSGHTFTAALFDGPSNAETLNGVVGDVFRKFLATPPPDYGFPAQGWYLAGADASSATFVARDAGGQELLTIGLANHAVGWEVDNYGACGARVVLNGLGNADWALDQTAPPPLATDSHFVALVREVECASGQSSATRIVPPAIWYEPDRILVMFSVRPPPGQLQTCQGNPSSRVVVILDEPIGDRQLLDAGRYPPGDPTKPLP